MEAQRAAPHSAALENHQERQSSRQAQLPCVKTVQLRGARDHQLILFLQTASPRSIRSQGVHIHTRMDQYMGAQLSVGVWSLLVGFLLIELPAWQWLPGCCLHSSPTAAMVKSLSGLSQSLICTLHNYAGFTVLSNCNSN